jgi:hypothetical protein
VHKFGVFEGSMSNHGCPVHTSQPAAILVVYDSDGKVLQLNGVYRFRALGVFERINDFCALSGHGQAMEWTPFAARRQVANVILISWVCEHIVHKIDLGLLLGKIDSVAYGVTSYSPW